MAGPIRIAILGNGRQARAEAALTARAYGVMGRSASRTGKLIAGAFAVGSIVRLGAAAGKAGATYVGALNKIQALTGSTDQQIDRAAGRIEANTSVFAKMGQTASDAAGGIVELTKSGLSLGQSLRAVRSTMVLAKAGELDVKDASELVANTLNTFSLKAKDASKIANGLANAANISSADVSDLAESFKYVSPLAAKAGVSLDQTNAVLAELSNSGIKASQAGTALRTFLLNLQAPTPAATEALKALNVQVYDAQGNMRPLPSLIGQLNDGLGDLSQAQQNAKLKDIFGKIGITGAQVILKNGTKGLAEYTKGVQRAGAANKLAQAASKGLAGTFSAIKAQVVSTVQSLYREYSPALDQGLRRGIAFIADHKQDFKDLASSAVPALQAVSDVATDHVYPALKSLWELGKDTAQAFGSGNGGLAKSIGKDLLGGLGDLADLVKKAADALDRLPGPVKAMAVEAGFAALVLPRLSGAITSVTSTVTTNIARLQQWRAEMTYAETRAQRVSAALTRLGAAARTAAGIAGMVALTQSAGKTNTAMGQLLRTAGLTAVGFSVGGPLGAAVGALAGTTWTLYDAFKGTDKQMDEARQTTIDYASALDKATGALTRLGREQIIQKLQQDGIIADARALGITTRDLVGATLGHAGAMRRVNDAYKRADDLVLGLKATKIGDWIYQQNIDLNNARRKVDEAASGYTNWKKALKGIPKDVQVRLRNLGFKPTLEQFRQIQRQAHLTPKQVRIIVKAIGYDPAITGAKRTGRALDELGRKKGDLTNWKRGLIQGLTEGQQQVHRGVGKMNSDLDSGVRQGATRAAGTASSGGNQVGGSLKSGILFGFSGTAAALAAAAASAVRQAIAAARAAADSHSPSRKTYQIGVDMGDGFVFGMRAREKAAAGAGKHYAEKLLRGVENGSEGISKVIDRITSLIEKKLDGKKQAGRRKALLKSLKDERAALVANGKAQDRNNKLLDKAIEKYKAIKQRADEFARSISSGFKTYGSIVGLGTTGGGTAVTLPAILSQLQARAGVAQQFAAIIQSLKSKLNKTSLRQLLEQAAGGDLEGALATAQAVAGGGAAAIAQINHLTEQIAQAGVDLAEKMRTKFFGHGLQVAEGVVEGLKRREKKLDRVADRLAAQFVRKAQEGLRISAKPSTLPASQTHNRTSAVDTYARSRASAATGGNTYQITVEVPVGADPVQIGKTITKYVDAYEQAGGRRRGVRK